METQKSQNSQNSPERAELEESRSLTLHDPTVIKSHGNLIQRHKYTVIKYTATNTREARIYNGEKTVSSISSAEKTG